MLLPKLTDDEIKKMEELAKGEEKKLDLRQRSATTISNAQPAIDAGSRNAHVIFQSDSRAKLFRPGK